MSFPYDLPPDRARHARDAAVKWLWDERAMLPENSEEIVDDVLAAALPHILTPEPTPEEVELLAATLWGWNQEFFTRRGMPYEVLENPTKDDLREIALRFRKVLWHV